MSPFNPEQTRAETARVVNEDHLGAVGRSCKGRHEEAANSAKSAHFVSTVTFSVQLHKLHSKVRMSTPSFPDTKPVNVIGPWHFGHGGRIFSSGWRA